MTCLFSHQKSFLQKNPGKTSLVWSCGTGKSRAALEWSKMHEGPTLVICPKALKTNWEREAKKWGAEIVVMTKETFKKEVRSLLPVKQVIVDEVHNGFLTPHFKSGMAKALRGYLKEYKVPRVLLLSATVYTSSPWNIFNLAYYTGYRWNYKQFDWKFFDHVRMGPRIIPVVKKGSEKKLAELTKQIASVVDIYDCMDVPPQIHCEPEYFSLTNQQKKAIKDNYDPLPIVRFTAQHEIENGILKGNEFRASQTFDCDKNDRILALVAENPKIAIVARYNEQIDALARLLATYKPFIIRGDVKDRDSVCLAAEAAERAVVLIQADSSLGYQLPSFGVCVFASMSYSYVNWEQLCGRFLRMDKPSKTTFIYLLTDGDSVDQAVYDAIKKKEDFKIELYAKKRSKV
jgi:superfamily II DNA or RNA helicase